MPLDEKNVGPYRILETKEAGIEQFLVAHILINKWLKFSLQIQY